ncbi:MAG: flavin reductase family protein [Candidatus Aminicenantes bacterium]|nr:flavin reductase family protein [Candidatus Aminicenantes bacterium]
MKKILTKIEKFQYFYPYSVAVVGAKFESGLNYMTCAWHTALSFSPPLFGVCISKKRKTHQLISEAREFSVNFLSIDQVKLSAQLGRRSGHELDKIKEFQVKLSPAQVIQSPILEEAYACFECRLIEIRAFGDHDLFVGEVLAIHFEEEAFDQDGVLRPGRISPLCYLGSDFYITLDPDTLNHVLPD